MTSREVHKLKTLLEADLVNNPEQERAQVRGMVKEWLMAEASDIAKRPVKVRQQILELIRIHAEAAILQKLIDKPTQFTVRDLKEILKEREAVEPGAKVDPMALINSLDIAPAEKAKLIGTMADLAKSNIRREIGRG